MALIPAMWNEAIVFNLGVIMTEMTDWKYIAGHWKFLAEAEREMRTGIEKELAELKAIVYDTSRRARPEIQQTGNLFKVNFQGG